MSSIAKSSLIVTIFAALGLGLGFLSNIVVAAKFGAGRDMDVFLAATTLPFFITTILSGSLNYTFIPVFAEYRTKEPNEIWKVVSSFINLNVVLTTVLCLLGIFFAHFIMKTIAPGFTDDKIARSAELLQWLFPIIIFTSINELMASVYYSNRRFIIPSLNKIISPVITMAYVIMFHNSLSTKSIALAMLTATFIQAVFLIIGILRTRDFDYSFVLDYKHPGVIKILKLMTPLVLGMIIYKAVPVIDRFFLSKLPDGSISHIGYAMKLISVIPSIIVSGISVSIFPVMSQYAAEKNWDALKVLMSKGIKMLFFLSIPFVLLLVFYGRSIIQLIFERGAFTSSDTTSVYYAFAIYLLSLPASVIGSVVSQGFYVLQENKIIATIGVLMMVLYVGMCWFLIKEFTYLAIPISYAIYFNCALVTTSMIIRKKIGTTNWPAIFPFILKSTAAVITAAILIYPAIRIEQEDKFISTALCGIGFLLYFVVSKFAFSIDEADSIWQTVTVRLKKGFSL